MFPASPTALFQGMGAFVALCFRREPAVRRCTPGALVIFLSMTKFLISIRVSVHAVFSHSHKARFGTRIFKITILVNRVLAVSTSHPACRSSTQLSRFPVLHPLNSAQRRQNLQTLYEDWQCPTSVLRHATKTPAHSSTLLTACRWRLCCSTIFGTCAF
jgi:hypothetical protein